MCEIPSVGKVKFTGTGDCAAANASGGIDTPVNRKGSCFFCTLEKDAWIDASKCATARKRTFVYQVRPAHLDFGLVPRPLLVARLAPVALRPRHTGQNA